MKKKLYIMSIIFILFLASLLRFTRYFDRWGLAYDQTHDVIVARYAIASGNIPLLGPFSSAGAFQTSGVWYWFIMIGTLFNPASILAPWVFLTVLYVVFVGLMIFLGIILVDRKFGLLLGLISALSTAQIAQGVNLTNQSPLSLTSLGAIFSFVLYGKTRRLRWLFSLGFFVSLSASIHLQGVSLLSLALLSLIIFGFPSFKGIFLLFCGLFIPTIPILLFDISHSFTNTKNMFYYIFKDQYRISLDVLGRRWKTFLMVFLTKEWAHVVGGIPIVGGILILLSFLVTMVNAKNYRKNKILIGLFISLVLMIGVLRYTRTPLFSSYIVFLHPFILLFSTLGLYAVFSKSKIIGVVVSITVIVLTLNKSISEIQYGSNQTDARAKVWVATLKLLYPTQKFSLYDYQYQASDQSLPLSLYLYRENLIADEGVRLAIMKAPIRMQTLTNLVFSDGDKFIYDVSSSKSGELERVGLGSVNPETVYASTEYWMDND